MDQALADSLEKFKAVHGGWTAHNIRLGEGVFTVSANPNYDNLKLNRVTQLIHALRRKAWSELRVLDLACQDGMYSLECGLQGAEVVGVEIREPHLARARFAREKLGLERVEFRQGDVRKVSLDRDGAFDVILLLGILYHLTAEDAAQLLETLGAMCTDHLIVDTHISLEAVESFTYRGATYQGRWDREHPSGLTQEQKASRLWYSWDNERSFLFTEESLVALLHHAGFDVVCRCLVPLEPGKPANRITLAALKREPCRLKAFPDLDPARVESYAAPVPPVHGMESQGLVRRAGRKLIRGVRRLLGPA